MTVDSRQRGQPCVLIADDDLSTRLIVREVLEQSGFRVVEAVDGREALQVYASAVPDLVLLDVEMPYLDGFSVCKKIRAKETSREIPICIVTGLDDADSIDRAYHVGATDFIGKPIAWPVLGHRLRYLLRASDAFNEIKGLVLALPDVVFILDENGSTLDCVTEANARLAGGIGAISTMAFKDVVPAEHDMKVRECIGLALQSGEAQIFEHPLPNSDGHLETRFIARDRNSVIAIVRNVTERKKAELQIFDLAFYDQLTGLPNRQLFSNELETMIEDARTGKMRFAILFVDLDRFKRINDTLGHSMGDELLKSVAVRLKTCLRMQDLIARTGMEERPDVHLARLGGDEFVVILRNVSSQDVAAAIASRIITSLEKPFNCGRHEFVVTPSIGIAMYPMDGDTNEELLMNADAAMYRAKAAGRNTYNFYSDTMKVRSLHRLELENELRQAIDEEILQLYYQPKVDLESWTIVGAEALLRWKHSERGWISPADFVPIAEETGLILPLGEWVLQAACDQLRLWQKSGLSHIKVSVNISSRQMHTADLVGIVKTAIADAGVDPRLLELEITESMLIRDVEATINALNTLKEFGVSIAVDDFGTGFSSLSYLTRFPIDVLKIDRSFVKDLHHNADDAAICAAILAMAHNLELQVVAEGVERKEQLDFLRLHKCEQIQGFLFSAPIPAKEFEALTLAHSNSRRTAIS